MFHKEQTPNGLFLLTVLNTFSATKNHCFNQDFINIINEHSWYCPTWTYNSPTYTQISLYSTLCNKITKEIALYLKRSLPVLKICYGDLLFSCSLQFLPYLVLMVISLSLLYRLSSLNSNIFYINSFLNICNAISKINLICLIIAIHRSLILWKACFVYDWIAGRKALFIVRKAITVPLLGRK